MPLTTPHTPGPWKYDRKNLRDNGVSVQGPDGHRICRVFSRPQDADLIAAAPDLLAELTESYVALLVTLSIQQRLGAQYLLVRILNSIARASGRTPQEVQDECESRAALTRAEGRAE